MKPTILGRFVLFAQWILAFALPVWVVLGREYVLGVETGWMVFVGAAYALTAVIALLIPPIVSMMDGDVRRAWSERPGYSVLMILAWIAVGLSALAMPDNGDDAAYDSWLTIWSEGEITSGRSTLIFYGLLAFAVLMLFFAFVLAIWGIVRAHRGAWRRRRKDQEGVPFTQRESKRAARHDARDERRATKQAANDAKREERRAAKDAAQAQRRAERDVANKTKRKSSAEVPDEAQAEVSRQADLESSRTSGI